MTKIERMLLRQMAWMIAHLGYKQLGDTEEVAELRVTIEAFDDEMRVRE